MADSETDNARPTPEDLGRAQRFAQYVAPTLVNVARRAVDLAAIEPGNSILDLGTATGLGAFLAAERAGRDGSVIGLDSSAAMLDVAGQRSGAVGYDFIHWQQGALAPLTYAEEAFDAVLCLHAVHRAADPFAVLEEARRVLVEGGRLVLTLWAAKRENEWITLLERALHEGARGVPPPPGPPLSRPGNLETLLQVSGFSEVEVARVPDRMRMQGVDAFWEWARAWDPWGTTLDSLPAAGQRRVHEALAAALRPRLRDGEVTIGREIVYARAIAPEST